MATTRTWCSVTVLLEWRITLKTNYGKVLANVATGVMHKPKSNLISALQINSHTLMQLTDGFKFRAPDIEILTFYETKPMGIFSSLVRLKGQLL